MKIVFLLVKILLISAFSASAQKYINIKGVVLDKDSKKPIPAASVYVNNTTFGVVNEDDGSFSLRVYSDMPFDLVISSIAYQTNILKVYDENNLGNLTIMLKPKVTELHEVTIQLPEKDGWELYGDMFIEELIGYSSFAAQCKLMNNEAVRFYFDQESGILRASADEPLRVLNNATGYEITYWLEDFELDTRNKQLYYKGFSYFKEISTNNKNKLRKWSNNRKVAYNGSINHFMKSLYAGNVNEEGFEIRKLKRVSYEEAKPYIPIKSDTFGFDDNERFKELLIDVLHEEPDPIAILNLMNNFKSWKEDSLNIGSFAIELPTDSLSVEQNNKYISFGKNPALQLLWMNLYHGESDINSNQDITIFGKEAIPEDKGIILEGSEDLFEKVRKDKKMNLLYPEVLNPENLIKRTAAQYVKLQFPEYLHITYLKELEEENFMKRRFPFFKGEAGPQISILKIKTPGLHVLQDGNFYNSYDLMVEEYWSYEKLDKLMPLDYKSEETKK